MACATVHLFPTLQEEVSLWQLEIVQGRNNGTKAI
jgi:hypothetical protein